MGIFMLKLRHYFKEDIENTAGIPCEQYLPGILQYLNYRVYNRMMSKLLGSLESKVGTIVWKLPCNLIGCMEVPA